ncbi:TIR domain-containing protein [Catellatospora methionotrophica]|uniref:TIR domain-containing protein n=1 Tax=Catellatospora methionotrophica TaxID=121620 RepID=UPI0033EEADB6
MTGLRVWSIEDLGRGDDWNAAMQEALARSRHMVVVVGGSGDVSRAVDIFERHSLDEDIERMIFPVLLGSATLGHARLRSRQALFVREPADLAHAATQIEQAASPTRVASLSPRERHPMPDFIQRSVDHQLSLL